MGLCLGQPCFSWASWLLGIIGFLSVYSNSAKGSGGHGPGIQDPQTPILLKGIQGGSVWFHVNERPGEDLRSKLSESSWSFASGSEYVRILRAQRTGDTLNLTIVKYVYLARVQMPNMTSLKIENLTPQDSGNYKIQGWLIGEKEFLRHFYLKVYEPVSPPQILVKALSITPGWCNVTLECRATGATEDLNVTWESRGVPQELGQRGTPGSGPDTWSQSMSLPLSQVDASLSCVVNNPVDQNNATSDLGDICSQGISGQRTASLTGGLLGGLVTILLLLGAGLCIWRLHKKKNMPLKQGARLEQDQNVCDHNITYAEITDQKSQKDKDKVISGTGGQAGHSQVTHCPAYAP